MMLRRRSSGCAVLQSRGSHRARQGVSARKPAVARYLIADQAPASSAQIGRDPQGRERTEPAHHSMRLRAHWPIAANDLLPTVFPPDVTDGRAVSSLL